LEVNVRIHLLPFCVSCAVCPSLLLSQALPYAYVITDLEEGTNLYGIANAMNARGDVVGDSNFQAFVWSHGTSSTPASLGNGFSTARGINDFGQVVGGAAPDGTSVAFLLDSSGLTTLEVPAGTTDCLAEAINNKGQVLVNTMAGSQSATFLWTQGTTREIPSLGGGSPRQCRERTGRSGRPVVPRGRFAHSRIPVDRRTERRPGSAPWR
jgi:hypothetical protein